MKKDVKTLTAQDIFSVKNPYDGSFIRELSGFFEKQKPEEAQMTLIATKNGQTETKDVYLNQKDIAVPKGIKYTKISKIEFYDKESIIKTILSKQSKTKTYVKFTFEEDKKETRRRKEEDKTKSELQDFLNKK